jgi:2-oxoglutarate/2-oxoacid ferredoxin oxidoreductase subunit beta
MNKYEKFATPNKINWCPGCGNYGIWAAFLDAALENNWDNNNTAIVAGIGCHGHIVNFAKLSGFEGLHGRALPLAAGLKMANHRLNVFVFTGDGDCLAEGGNHFIHSARRNHNLTVILHDNAIYGLTTGQTSPRSPLSFKSKSTPTGNIDTPLNPLALAFSAGATFLARAYAGDPKSLTKIISAANQHDGFSLIDVLQPCVTFNKDYTHEFYQQNTYWLDENYHADNKKDAWEKINEWGDKKIPLGIIYKEERLSHEAQIPQIKDEVLIKIPLGERRDIQELYNKLR